MFGCWLSFSEKSKLQWWYIPLGIGLGMASNFLWFFCMKNLEDKYKAYILALIWEALVVAVYYGMPPLLFGVKIDRWTLFSMVLILTGIILLKCKN